MSLLFTAIASRTVVDTRHAIIFVEGTDERLTCFVRSVEEDEDEELITSLSAALARTLFPQI